MPDQIDTKNHPLVKALAAHQERLGISNKRFSNRYLNCSDATWSLFKSGNYPGSAENWLEKWPGVLEQLNDEAAAMKEIGGDQTIVDFPEHRAAALALRRCARHPQNRLVVYLAVTGGGKTTLTQKLGETYGGQLVRVEATECWRHSYLSFLNAICEALGISGPIDSAFLRKSEAEEAAREELTRRPRILAIDEAHYAGPAALNFFKLLLNTTMSRIILLAIPQLWRQMSAKASEEAAQLRRRTAAKIVVQEIRRADAQLFLSTKMGGYSALKDDGKEAVRLCTEAANRFGYCNALLKF